MSAKHEPRLFFYQLRYLAGDAAINAALQAGRVRAPDSILTKKYGLGIIFV